MKGVEIRPARPADVEDIADVRIRTWRVAYRGLLPDDVLDKLVISPQRIEAHRHAIVTGADVRTFVATTGSEIVGFATGGVCRDDEPPGVGELWALYLDPTLWGHHVGTALHDAVLRHLADGEHHSAIAWMVDGNARAMGFYERQGWAPDGGRRMIDLGAVVPEVRLRRKL